MTSMFRLGLILKILHYVYASTIKSEKKNQTSFWFQAFQKRDIQLAILNGSLWQFKEIFSFIFDQEATVVVFLCHSEVLVQD
jgi:hypothetical protein